MTPLPAAEAARSCPRPEEAGREEPARGTRVSPPRAGQGWPRRAARAGSQTFGTEGSPLSTDRLGAGRRGPSLVRRILPVEAGLAEQLPASAAAPAAGRAGGEVRPGPSPLEQSGGTSFGAPASAALAPLGLSPPLAAPRGGRGRTGPARQRRPYLSPSALQRSAAARPGRTLFPLPGVSPAVRKPEAVFPRSASPPCPAAAGQNSSATGAGVRMLPVPRHGKLRSGGTEDRKSVV